MEEKYNWTIVAYDYKVDSEGLKNVIENIHWRYGNQNIDVYGVISLPSPTPENFTNIDDVTKEIASTWIESIFSFIPEDTEFSKLEEMQRQLNDKLLLKQTPITITKYL